MVTEASGGGAGRHVLDLSDGLIRRGWDVHLIYSPNRLDRFFRTRLHGIDGLSHAVCPMRRNIEPRDFAAMRWICRYAREWGPFELIHGHSAKGGALARLAGFITRTPVVYTLHGCVLMDPGLSRLKRWLYATIETSLSKVTDRIIAVAPEEQRFLVANGFGPARVDLVPNGIAPIAFPSRSEARRDLGIADDALVVGFVGRLVDQKAPDILLKAFAAASRAVTSGRLLVIGSGPLEESLRALADDLGISDRVIWAGERDATMLLPAFDLFAIASRKEGFPYVTLEALAAGLPIVATAAAGVELTIRDGENGRIVPPGQVDPLAAALVDLLSDHRRRSAFGRASRRQALRFTSDAMVDHTIEVYTSCARGTATQVPRLPPAARGRARETFRLITIGTPEGGSVMASRPRSAEIHPGPGFRVKTNVTRLDWDLMEQFRDHATPDISDLLNRLYAMDPAIRCLTGAGHVLCGPALTVKVFPGDNLMVHKALDVAQPGDIVVVDAGGSTQYAVLGDLISTKARHRGIAGFIVDGMVRDLPSILPLDFPVFARGTTPIGPLHRGPGEINYPICCGGIVVNPGDLIVGDAAGAIVVPKEIAAELLERLELHRETNEAYLQAVRRGEFSNVWVDQVLEEHHCLIVDGYAPHQNGGNGAGSWNGRHPAQRAIVPIGDGDLVARTNAEDVA
jgi:RraA family protein